MVSGADFWHNEVMPTRDEKNAELPHAVLPPADPKSVPATLASLAPAVTGHPSASPKPSGEIGGPAGPEPTRFGDWERKGRCIDF